MKKDKNKDTQAPQPKPRLGLTHIALKVFDPEKSADFYKRWCGMELVHQRGKKPDTVIWMSSPDYVGDFVIVFLGGRDVRKNSKGELEHMGIAVESVDKVKEIAEQAKKEGILHWDVMEMGYPVGTICAITDPDGNVIEFSYGQPIGFSNDNIPPEKPEHNTPNKTCCKCKGPKPK